MRRYSKAAAGSARASVVLTRLLLLLRPEHDRYATLDPRDLPDTSLPGQVFQPPKTILLLLLLLVVVVVIHGWRSAHNGVCKTLGFPKHIGEFRLGVIAITFLLLG